MLLSCKCLNFNASSKNQYIKTNIGSNESIATSPILSFEHGDVADSRKSNDGKPVDENRSLIMTLTQAFMQKFPTTFPFHSQCVEFFKQSILQVSDIAINAVHQPDLIYNFTLETQKADNGNLLQVQSWKFYICINCNTVLYGKKLNTKSIDMIDDIQSVINPQQQYIINCSLLTNNEELTHRRSDNSFSTTFGILILDYPKFKNSKGFSKQSVITDEATVGSLSTPATFNFDLKQQRIKHLQKILQTRIQKEIVDTDERIQRYSDQQFALLKDFRERSELEFRLLVNLIRDTPEDYSCSEQLLSKEENMGLDVQERRSMVDGRYDLNTLPADTVGLSAGSTENSAMTRDSRAITTLMNPADPRPNKSTQCKMGVETDVQNNTNGGNTFNEFLQRKMSNFDTPPATPEAVPMSVGNSPNFRQIKQQQNNGTATSFNAIRPQNGNNSTIPLSSTFPVEVDDNIFEMEGVDNDVTLHYSLGGVCNNYLHEADEDVNSGIYRSKIRNQLEESDSAEEAEDALGYDCSESIPVQDTRHRRSFMGHMQNFARSLPIEIANSPLAERRNINRRNIEENEINDTVDIAASIKALAKSVHGEAVFGDLPKPRLSTQL